MRKLPPASKLDKSIVGKIILKLTEIKPDKRPSAHQIREDWLSKWKASLEQM
jgi:hypothetical protein